MSHFSRVTLALCCLLLTACDGVIIGGNPSLIRFEQDEQTQKLLETVSQSSHRQYPLTRSNDPFHLALDGRGFFVLEDPQSGQQYYTRYGAFVRDANNALSTTNGFRLVPQIRVEPGEELVIDSTGRVFIDGRLSENLKVALFEDDSVLEALGNLAEKDVYRMTRESGKPALLAPQVHDNLSDVSTGMIIQRALESFSGTLQEIPERGCKNQQSAQSSGDSWDLLIEGPGFFQILDSRTGELFFTRTGDFTLADGSQDDIPAGTLVYDSYFVLEPRVVLRSGQELERIDAQGQVFVQGETEAQAQIQLAQFDRLQQLVPLGFSRGELYRRLSGSGYSEDPPGSAGLGTLRSGRYEVCRAARF